MLCNKRMKFALKKYIYIFRSWWFFKKGKLCRMLAVCAQICWYFSNWTHKNIPDWQQCVSFRKSQKVKNHSSTVHMYSTISSPYWLILNAVLYTGLGICSFQKNVPFFVFFCVLYRRTFHSLRSFPFRTFQSFPF